MRLLAIIALITLIMPSVAYQNHGIAFDIPKKWQLVSDQLNNSTQTNGTLLSDAKIELTDGKSTIRIDVVNSPRIAELIGVTDPEPKPYVLDEFYQKSVLNRDTNNTHGRGTLYNDYWFWFYYNESDEVSDECKSLDLKEYLECWKWKPEICKEIVLVKPLKDQMIGLYGRFNGTYDAQEIGMMKYPMLQPIYDIANSLEPF